MDEMIRDSETQPDELNGKRISISLNEYYQLLNDNSVLMSVKNALTEGTLKYAIGDYKKRNREECLTRYNEQNAPKAKFVLGSPVLFAFMFGQDSPGRYDGQVKLGFVQKTEYIAARKTWLYHLAFPHTMDTCVGYIALDEHLVFDLDEKEKCEQAIQILKERK